MDYLDSTGQPIRIGDRVRSIAQASIGSEGVVMAFGEGFRGATLAVQFDGMTRTASKYPENCLLLLDPAYRLSEGI